jgi:hypothetical protein
VGHAAALQWRGGEFCIVFVPIVDI